MVLRGYKPVSGFLVERGSADGVDGGEYAEYAE